MAFELSPKFTQYYLLGNLSPSQFLVLAIESIKKQDWNIIYTSETRLIAHTEISLTSQGEEIKIKIERNRAVIESESIDHLLINYIKNEGNVQAFMSTLHELASTISAEELQQQYETIQHSLISKEQDVLSQPPSTIKKEIARFFSIFVPREGYYITPILISLNVVIFVLMVLSGVGIMMPASESLIAWGANYKPITLEGEWWRLITCCFVHIGILHLVMNMFALLYIGLLLEPILGKTRFCWAYLLTGLASSLNSLWWHDLAVSAGASGAIFGMYGVFLALLMTDMIEKSTRKALLTSIGIFVVFNLVNGMKGGVDNAAHIGGLISGLLIGFSYIPSLKRPDDSGLKKITIVLIAVLVVGTTVVVYCRLPNEIGKYERDMKAFFVNQRRALKIYTFPESTPTSTILHKIQDSGLYLWRNSLQLLKDADKLQVPASFHDGNKKLIDYCNLRIKSYELLYKAYYENTDKYKDALDSCNAEIEQALNHFK